MQCRSTVKDPASLADVGAQAGQVVEKTRLQTKSTQTTKRKLAYQAEARRHQLTSMFAVQECAQRVLQTRTINIEAQHNHTKQWLALRRCRRASNGGHGSLQE